MKGWILRHAITGVTVHPPRADGWWTRKDAEFARDRLVSSGAAPVAEGAEPVEVVDLPDESVLLHEGRTALPHVWIRVVDGRPYLSHVRVDGVELKVARVQIDTGERIDGLVRVRIDMPADVTVEGEADVQYKVRGITVDEAVAAMRTSAHTGSDDKRTGAQTGADKGPDSGAHTGSITSEWPRECGQCGSSLTEIRTAAVAHLMVCIDGYHEVWLRDEDPRQADRWRLL